MKPLFSLSPGLFAAACLNCFEEDRGPHSVQPFQMGEIFSDVTCGRATPHS